MDLLIIGDIHGCFYTLKEMVEKYWEKEQEELILVGDLIDRGNFSPQTVEYSQNLKKNYPNQVTILKGNHEFEIIEHFVNGPNHHWLRQCGDATLRQYKAKDEDLNRDINWFKHLPLSWENEYVLVSHAGIAENEQNPYAEDNPTGVLWNREPLKNVGKVQIIGHTPVETPTYDKQANAWNIDTGAAYNGYLTAVKVTKKGKIKDFVKVMTNKKDIEKIIRTQ